MLFDSWKVSSRAEPVRGRPAVKRSRHDQALVDRAIANMEAMGREAVLDFIDASALGGVGRNVSNFRRTNDSDQLREALITLEITHAAVVRLLNAPSVRPAPPG